MAKPDVIAAIATATGRAAVGVVKLSGAELHSFFSPLLGHERLEPRRATLTRFLDATGTPIDFGLALYFPAPGSYTGEDVLELQGHGGTEVLRLLLRRCLEVGARLAEPGEFTRRAYLNGRLDLAQAEAVADLIEARSELAARSALRSLSGQFSAEIQGLIDDLVELRTLVEACIDFPDEDVELLSGRGGMKQLEALTGRLLRVRQAAKTGSILRDGAFVVLFGRPNVGKSSLLNRFAGDEIAIVTEIPGTTRDSLRELIDLDGVPIHMIDTAGLRSSEDQVEVLGMSMTWRKIASADLALLVTDAAAQVSNEDQELLSGLPSNVSHLVVHNKIDVSGEMPRVEYRIGSPEVWVSAQTGAGLDLLRGEILRRIGWQPQEEGVFLARERHLRALEQASRHLEQARNCREALELFAEELRLAQTALSQIAGEFTSDDLLGQIFSRFCIGK